MPSTAAASNKTARKGSREIEMKRFLAICVVMILFATAGAVQAAIQYDQNVTNQVIFGSGNGNGAFTTDRDNGVELGLRAKLRGAGIYNSNHDGTYDQAVGTIWNFEWSINTDYDGTTGWNLNDLTYVIRLDTDTSYLTNFVSFDPINAANPSSGTVLWDHGIGDNSTANGAGDNDTGRTVATYAALIAGNNLAQNSWQLTWYDPLYSKLVDATYTIELEAFYQGDSVASTSINVIVGAGGAVPEPATMIVWGLLGAVAAGYGVRRRCRAG
jgi:hypothetical protein